MQPIDFLSLLKYFGVPMRTPNNGKPLVVKFKKQHPEAQVPIYQKKGDSGADLYSVETVTIEPGQRAIVDTGISLELPNGYEAQVRSRSGLAAKDGVFVLNSPGTIDSGYKGNVKVILFNTNNKAHYIAPGNRIAQLVISPVFSASFEEVQELSESDRGTGGFGSTGK